jgi:Tfp pilus assembly protein PilV
MKLGARHSVGANRKRAFGIVEVLVAGVLLTVSLAAIASMFTFGFRVTKRTDDQSVAYNISRKELERIRSEGFSNAVIVRDVNGVVTSKGRDGSETIYYNANGTKLANSTGAAYSVAISIVSDSFDTVGGIQRPAGDALRTVTLTVRSLADNTVVLTDGTFLARSGL